MRRPTTVTLALLAMVGTNEARAGDRTREEECHIDVTIERRQLDHIERPRSVIRLENVELLDAVRPYVTMSERCEPSEVAEVCLTIETTATKQVAPDGTCDVIAFPRRPGEPAPGDITLHQLLSRQDPDRLADFRAGELGDATFFDLILYAAYYVKPGTDGRARSIDALAGAKENLRLHQSTVRATVALSHDIATLSLVAQPARAMFALTGCRGATGSTGGVLPDACSNGEGPWLGSINASAFGVKVFWAPVIRYPWVGWSVQASTGILGYAAQLVAEEEESEPVAASTGGLFSSPLDLSASLIDFRIPSPVRIDFGLFAGTSLIRQSKTEAYRFVPQIGVSLTTPLVDVFGTRFNRRESAITDHRTLAPIERELMAAIVAADAARAKVEEKDVATRSAEALTPGAEVCKLLDTYVEQTRRAVQILDETPDLRIDHRYEVAALQGWGGEDDPVRQRCDLPDAMDGDATDLRTAAKTIAPMLTDAVAAADAVDAALQPLLATPTPDTARRELRDHLAALKAARDAAAAIDLSQQIDPLDKALTDAHTALTTAGTSPDTVAARLQAFLTAYADADTAVADAIGQIEALDELVDLAPNADEASKRWPLEEDPAWTSVIASAEDIAAEWVERCADLYASESPEVDLTPLTGLSDKTWPLPTTPGGCDEVGTLGTALDAARVAAASGDTPKAWEDLAELEGALAGARKDLDGLRRRLDTREAVRRAAALRATAAERSSAQATRLLEAAERLLASGDPPTQSALDQAKAHLDKAETLLAETTP